MRRTDQKELKIEFLLQAHKEYLLYFFTFENMSHYLKGGLYLFQIDENTFVSSNLNAFLENLIINSTSL